MIYTLQTGSCTIISFEGKEGSLTFLPKKSRIDFRIIKNKTIRRIRMIMIRHIRSYPCLKGMFQYTVFLCSGQRPRRTGDADLNGFLQTHLPLNCCMDFNLDKMGPVSHPLSTRRRVLDKMPSSSQQSQSLCAGKRGLFRRAPTTRSHGVCTSG